MIPTEDKANSIIDCAQALGLQVNLEMSEAIKEVSSRLEESEL